MTAPSIRDATDQRIAPRFTFDDAKRAHKDWGANCGPGALAVVAGLSLDQVRPYLGDFESKGYTNPTLMFDSLRRIGLSWQSVKPAAWPTFGLVRIQWEGPWMEPGVPLRARYRHTHWVAGARRNGEIGVFDINCMNNGTGWVSLEEWSRVVAPYLIQYSCKRGNGRWSVTHSLERCTKEYHDERL